MPLVRYDTGDLARAHAGPCSCGRDVPVLGRLEGRARSSLVSDGRLVTTRALADGLGAVASPERVRVRRAPDGSVRLEVAPGVSSEPAAAVALAQLVGPLAGVTRAAAPFPAGREKTELVAA